MRLLPHPPPLSLLWFPLRILEHLLQLSLMRLYPRDAQLRSCGRELREFLDGLLPDRRLVKRRELLQLVRRERLGIKRHELLLDALPTQVFPQKLLEYVPTRSELRMLLEQESKELLLDPVQRVFGLQDQEQVRSGLAMPCFLRPNDRLGEDQCYGDQARL